MTVKTQPTDEQREIAALWLAKRTGGVLSVDEELEFETWLNTHRLNRLAWDEMRVLWAHLEQPATHVAQFSPPRSGLTRHVFSLRGGFALSGSLIAASLAILVINPYFLEDLQADIVSGAQIVTSVTLPDGSHVQMAANSALALQFDEHQRHVRLLRGEAFFNVTPGSKPDFSIDINGDTVRVIGTRFNVDNIADKTTIVVEEGIVSVQGAQDGATERLTHGEQITVSAGKSGEITPVEPKLALAWLSGRLVVDQAPVADVVATLTRHNREKFYVRGALRDKRISGTFSLQDIEGSIETIAAAVDAKALRQIPFVTIIY